MSCSSFRTIVNGSYGNIKSAPNGGLYGAKIVTIGDSIMAGNVEITSAGGSTVDPSHGGQRGFISWTQALCGFPLAWRFYNENATTVGGNAFAVSGDSITNVMGRLAGALKQKPDIVYLHMGTNDITAGETTATIVDAYKWIIRRCKEAGVMLWMNTILPRTVLTAPQEIVRRDVNTEILTFETQFKGYVLVFNCEELPTAYLSDGTHPNATGGKWLAENVIVPKLGAFYGIKKVKRGIPGDFNSTTSPMGNLLTNSDFTGTGGTVTGTGISGTAPDSWTATRTDGTGTTAVFSIESLTDWNGDTRNFSVMTMSSTGVGAAAETIRIAPSSTITTNVVAGEWYVAEVECQVNDVASGSNILQSVYAELRDNGTSGPISRFFNVGYTDASSNKEYFPTGTTQILLRTFPFRANTASGLILRINADIDGTLTGSRVVKFGKAVVRPVKFMADSITAPQYKVPSAGDTVYVRGGAVTNLILKPAGTLATLTITMPALPQNGDIVTITSTQIVTTLTLTSGKTVNGALTALTANGFATYQYQETADQWFRIG